MKRKRIKISEFNFLKSKIFIFSLVIWILFYRFYLLNNLVFLEKKILFLFIFIVIACYGIYRYFITDKRPPKELNLISANILEILGIFLFGLIISTFISCFFLFFSFMGRSHHTDILKCDVLNVATVKRDIATVRVNGNDESFVFRNLHKIGKREIIMKEYYLELHGNLGLFGILWIKKKKFVRKKREHISEVIDVFSENFP